MSIKNLFLLIAAAYTATNYAASKGEIETWATEATVGSGHHSTTHWRRLPCGCVERGDAIVTMGRHQQQLMDGYTIYCAEHAQKTPNSTPVQR
jgi:hypothetical protein